MFHSIYKKHKITCWLLSGILLLCMNGCKKYLDLRANSTLVIPSTLADCQALLDNYFVISGSYPTNEQSADNYYLTTAGWNSLTNKDRDLYVWAAQTDMNNNGGWQSGYQKVMYANTVLETLDDITAGTSNQAEYNKVKGQALFFRGFSFYMMAQVWAQPYNSASASTDLGIPLRLASDISISVPRSTVQQTYDRIISDLKAAVMLLPADQPTSIITKYRPSKAAAYAALARTYLSISDYANAGLYADSCLQNYNTLLDYNQLNATAFFPIARYNAEVILDAQGATTPALVASIARVDSNLHASYAADDLRRTVFFQENTGANVNTWLFKGSYAATNSTIAFCGFATDEMYLTRAESYARAGNSTDAMEDLNTLLRNRWTTGTYTDLTATDAADALSKILVERRKELLFRSIRWTDLRRLNMEPAHAVTLYRILDGTTYTLAPNDLRYTMLIPQSVLKLENLQQNPR
jgi:hypothetical protein